MIMLEKLVSYLWFRRWLYTAIVVAAIFYLTLVPRPLPPELTPLIPGLDKAVHGIMFLVLTLVASLDCGFRSRRQFVKPKTSLLVAIAICSALFGGAIEIVQNAMNMGRGGDAADFAADAIGSFLGLLLACHILVAVSSQSAS